MAANFGDEPVNLQVPGIWLLAECDEKPPFMQQDKAL